MEAQANSPDRAATAVPLALMALCLGYAVDLNDGGYSPTAIFFLSAGLFSCIIAIARPEMLRLEVFCVQCLPLLLACGIAIQTYLLLTWMRSDSQVSLGVGVIAALGFVQFFDRPNLRFPLIFIMSIAFFFVGATAFNRYAKNPQIDVYMFQWAGSYALRHGINPYAFRYPSVYPVNTPFYGPGVVGPDGNLTFGFPYPPLSLLMVFPAWLIGDDPRYAHVLAMAVSACLLALVRPGRAGRIGALAATLFLLTPRAVYVLDLAWTEPLLVLTFSIAMFCAIRRNKFFPYALGLFFATKQYTVLALPLLPLLVIGPGRRKQLINIIIKAAIVILLINLPFLLWNPREFCRALAELQLVQPFRTDALSYLVWYFKQSGGVKLPAGISLLAILPAYALALWRCPRSTSGFAGGLTLVLLVFFAFNKQAFCNYYYFVIATGCWAIATADIFPLGNRGFEVIPIPGDAAVAGVKK